MCSIYVHNTNILLFLLKLNISVMQPYSFYYFIFELFPGFLEILIVIEYGRCFFIHAWTEMIFIAQNKLNFLILLVLRSSLFLGLLLLFCT